MFEPLTAASDLPLRCLVEGRPLNYGCERAVISIVEASRKCQKGAKNPPEKTPSSTDRIWHKTDPLFEFLRRSEVTVAISVKILYAVTLLLKG